MDRGCLTCLSRGGLHPKLGAEEGRHAAVCRIVADDNGERSRGIWAFTFPYLPEFRFHSGSNDRGVFARAFRSYRYLLNGFYVEPELEKSERCYPSKG